MLIQQGPRFDYRQCFRLYSVVYIQLRVCVWQHMNIYVFGVCIRLIVAISAKKLGRKKGEINDMFDELSMPYWRASWWPCPGLP